MNMTTTRHKTGDLVCTVARDGSRMANCGGGHHKPIWTGAIYEAVPRTRDGVLTWRRIGSFGDTRCGIAPSSRFVEELKELAEYEWLNVRHGQLV